MPSPYCYLSALSEHLGVTLPSKLNNLRRIYDVDSGILDISHVKGSRMFDRLGNAIARRPKFFVFGWVLLLIFGSVSALWGFGQGNIFQRMESSESMVPGSQSDAVIEKTSEESSVESAIVVITGVNADEVEAELEAFRTELEGIDGVEQVVDPIAIDAEFAAAASEAVDDAVSQALADNAAAIQEVSDAAIAQAEPQIQEAIAGAIAQAEPEIQAVIASAVAEAQAENPGVPVEILAQQIEPEVRAQATAEIEAQVREAATEETASIPNPADDFRSDEGFVVAVNVPGEDTGATEPIQAASDSFEAEIQKVNSDAQANVSSSAIMENLILDMVMTDLIRGEAIGLPIALLLLVIVFGGLLAAGLPLIGALTSIAVGMGLLWVLTYMTNVDSFILNIISVIGLALSIDYGLLIVSRYREEVAEALGARGLALDGSEAPDDMDALVDHAVTTTVATAGRTVSFSALTIAFSIAGLLVMEAPMLKMIAFGGVIVTVLAVATAVTMVPALIKLLGHRLVAPSWLSKRKGFGTLVEKVGDTASDEGFFSKLAKWVHDRPVPILLAVTAILLVMASPIRDLEMRSNFFEYIPADSDAAVAVDDMQDYRAFATPSGTIIADAIPEDTGEFVNFIEGIDGVEWVSEPVVINGGETQIDFYVPADDQVGDEVTDVVQDIRNHDPGYKTDVGGSAALQLDFNQSVIDGAPLAAVVVVLAVLILLFLMTGSVMAPLKALVINTLSLVAGMGATVFVFNNGLFGLPQTNGLETFVVAAAIAFGFGLAMDYEVFLLARIKEYWDLGEDNDTAVEKGLQRSGRIITSAAAIIVAVFIGFVFGDMLAIKQVGVALALIVIVDATLVRMLLVPATMTLLGKWNWWAPKPLKRVYEKFKIVH